MIQFLDILSFLLEWSYCVVFYWIIHTFLPLHKNKIIRIIAFFTCSFLAVVVVYSNDFVNLFGVFLGITLYIFIFHCGYWMRKITAVLILYPALIAINYLMQDIGSNVFFFITNVSDESFQWTQKQWLISTGIHTFSLLLRLLFWLVSYWFLKIYLSRITQDLTKKMWFVIDVLMLAPFVAIFTIIYFMPENPWIVYPICGASIFSSFGCIYLASYICTSMQIAFHAQELERKQAYYHEKINDEKRVREVYHDLKNHLLILQGQMESSQIVQQSVKELQSQIQKYENYYNTGNDFLDIIIREKANIAQKKKIDFHAMISFQDGSFLRPLDISTIFGNALDNAIEASEPLSQDKRLITVKVERVRDMLLIVIENNILLEPALLKETTKADRFMHGFGISNIKNTVEKYNGQCSIKSENEKFILKIMIPIP